MHELKVPSWKYCAGNYQYGFKDKEAGVYECRLTVSVGIY
jgi:hypothetical protein